MKILSLLLLATYTFAQTKPDDIQGVWLSENKDLKVEIQAKQ